MIPLVCMFFASTATGVVMVGIDLHTAQCELPIRSSMSICWYPYQTDVVLPLPTTTLCVAVKQSQLYFVSLWISVLAFELILCALAIYKGFLTLQKDSQTGGWSCGRTLSVLVKDSILYFIMWVTDFESKHKLWDSESLLLFSISMSYLAVVVIWIVDYASRPTPLALSYIYIHTHWFSLL